VDFDIDIVIPWVNGNDLVWQEKMKKVKRTVAADESERDLGQEGENRYRDFDTLKFLLRSIDVYTPWVRKVLLITDQQVPEWLNRNEEKVQIVDHTDYIPSQHLPTFNSNVIELFAYKIPDLAEHFILMNDDFIFAKPVKKSDFFSKYGQPVDVSAQNAFSPNNEFDYNVFKMLKQINTDFNKRDWLKEHFRKAFSFKNGLIYTPISMFLSIFPKFTGFYDPHSAAAYRKEDFEQAWEAYPTFLGNSLSAFRSRESVSHWFVRYLRLMRGDFVNQKITFNRYLPMSRLNVADEAFYSKKYGVIILNDEDENMAFVPLHEAVTTMLIKHFPEKSRFEK